MRLPVTTRAGVAAAVLAGFALAGCSTAAQPDDAERTLRIAVSGMPSTNGDPVAGAILYAPPDSQPFYESLVVVDTDSLEYVPWLAEEYEISDDRRAVTFTLRDVEFTDGEPLTAEGVVKEWELVMAGGIHFAVAEMKAFGAEIAAIDARTVEITTDSGVNDRFFDALSYLPIVSPAALDDLETLATAPVGTGPYLVDEILPDVSVSYVRNPDYWRPEAYDFDRVVFQVYADTVAAVNALKSGQVDATRLDVSQVREVEASGFTVVEGGGEVFGLSWLDWTGTVSPALADVRVRQAISLAFDRDGINASLNLGLGRVTSQVFAEGMDPYIDGGDDRYPYDVERAKDLMREAGYPNGFDISIPTIGLYAPYEPIVEQTLGDLGIRVTWVRDEADPAIIFTAPGSGKYALLLHEEVSYGLVTWLSEGGWFTGFGVKDPDPEIAELTNVIDNGTEAERAAAAQELGAKLLDEAWYIPFSTRYQVWGLAPGVDLDLGNRPGWPIQLREFTSVG